MMEQFFNQAWRKQAWWLWLLLPVAWLYGLLSSINKKVYQLGLKPIYYPSVPTIVIGNITVGGSGKTPLIIALVDYLQQKNIRVGVISRGYGSDSDSMPLLVSIDSQPQQVGDEPCLIVQSTHVPMAVSSKRGEAIDLLLKNYPETQLILADDGLQHHALDRDQNWIVVDGDRGFGNGQLLPVGFLRESKKRLHAKNTTVIYHQQSWDNVLSDNQNSLSKGSDLFMRLVEAPLEPLFSSKSAFDVTANKIQQVIAMSGIGYPQRFFNSLSKLGFELIKKPFNDHHRFTITDFENLPLDVPIVVTTKDAVKLRVLLTQDNSEFAQSLKSRIWVLPVIAQLSDSVFDTLNQQLIELNILKH